MSTFTGVFRYEYSMSTRRWGLWLTFGILILLHSTSFLMPTDMIGALPAEGEVLSYAGSIGFIFNLFMPVVGGIMAADRMMRDRKLKVDELLRSTALQRWQYVAGKYGGVLCSIVTPVLVCNLLMGIKLFAAGAPIAIFPALLLSFVMLNLPAYAFIVAFSLGCPLVIPVRVYQVLFVGYWFWGNFISPDVMPTLNGTYLTVNGTFALLGLFGGFFGGGGPTYINGVSQTDALINLAVIAGVTALALFATERCLAWQAQRA